MGIVLQLNEFEPIHMTKGEGGRGSYVACSMIVTIFRGLLLDGCRAANEFHDERRERETANSHDLSLLDMLQSDQVDV